MPNEGLPDPVDGVGPVNSHVGRADSVDFSSDGDEEMMDHGDDHSDEPTTPSSNPTLPAEAENDAMDVDDKPCWAKILHKKEENDQKDAKVAAVRFPHARQVVSTLARDSAFFRANIDPVGAYHATDAISFCLETHAFEEKPVDEAHREIVTDVCTRFNSSGVLGGEFTLVPSGTWFYAQRAPVLGFGWEWDGSMSKLTPKDDNLMEMIRHEVTLICDEGQYHVEVLRRATRSVAPHRAMYYFRAPPGVDGDNKLTDHGGAIAGYLESFSAETKRQYPGASVDLNYRIFLKADSKGLLKDSVVAVIVHLPNGDVRLEDMPFGVNPLSNLPHQDGEVVNCHFAVGDQVCFNCHWNGHMAATCGRPKSERLAFEPKRYSPMDDDGQRKVVKPRFDSVQNPTELAPSVGFSAPHRGRNKNGPSQSLPPATLESWFMPAKRAIAKKSSSPPPRQLNTKSANIFDVLEEDTMPDVPSHPSVLVDNQLALAIASAKPNPPTGRISKSGLSSSPKKAKAPRGSTRESTMILPAYQPTLGRMATDRQDTIVDVNFQSLFAETFNLEAFDMEGASPPRLELALLSQINLDSITEGVFALGGTDEDKDPHICQASVSDLKTISVDTRHRYTLFRYVGSDKFLSAEDLSMYHLTNSVLQDPLLESQPDSSPMTEQGQSETQGSSSGTPSC